MKKILFLFIVSLTLMSCSNKITITYIKKTDGGCYYELSNKEHFFDRQCRYKLGEEMDPYFERGKFKSKHSH